MERFYMDGIFVFDRYGEFVSLMFNDKSHQKKCVKWLNGKMKEIDDLNNEISQLKKLVKNYQK